MKQKVFVTRIIPAPAIALLKKHFQVQVYQKDQVIPRMELIKGVKWCDALLCLLTDKIDAEIIEANPRLKIISNYAVGYNNIDLAAARQRGLIVTNTPDVLTDATADLTWALLLATARRVVEGDALVRSGKWTGWSPTQLLGSEVTGKTLGIIGMGRIGKAMAAAGKGIGMNVVYWSQKTRVDTYRFVELQELFKQPRHASDP